MVGGIQNLFYWYSEPVLLVNEAEQRHRTSSGFETKVADGWAGTANPHPQPTPLPTQTHTQIAYKTLVFPLRLVPTDRRTDGPTDPLTDGQTDGQSL